MHHFSRVENQLSGGSGDAMGLTLVVSVVIGERGSRFARTFLRRIDRRRAFKRAGSRECNPRRCFLQVRCVEMALAWSRGQARAGEKWFALEGFLLEDPAFLWRCGAFGFRFSSCGVLSARDQSTIWRRGSEKPSPSFLHRYTEPSPIRPRYFFRQKEKNRASAADSLAGACHVYPEG
jgi:hypothetical protein